MDLPRRRGDVLIRHVGLFVAMLCMVATLFVLGELGSQLGLKFYLYTSGARIVPPGDMCLESTSFALRHSDLCNDKAFSR